MSCGETDVEEAPVAKGAVDVSGAAMTWDEVRVGSVAGVGGVMVVSDAAVIWGGTEVCSAAADGCGGAAVTCWGAEGGAAAAVVGVGAAITSVGAELGEGREEV